MVMPDTARHWARAAVVWLYRLDERRISRVEGLRISRGGHRGSIKALARYDTAAAFTRPSELPPLTGIEGPQAENILTPAPDRRSLWGRGPGALILERDSCSGRQLGELRRASHFFCGLPIPPRSDSLRASCWDCSRGCLDPTAGRSPTVTWRVYHGPFRVAKRHGRVGPERGHSAPRSLGAVATA
jgi:hypothetical protein